jgi:hypothetical protein
LHDGEKAGVHPARPGLYLAADRHLGCGRRGHQLSAHGSSQPFSQRSNQANNSISSDGNIEPGPSTQPDADASTGRNSKADADNTPDLHTPS